MRAGPSRFCFLLNGLAPALPSIGGFVLIVLRAGTVFTTGGNRQGDANGRGYVGIVRHVVRELPPGQNLRDISFTLYQLR
jgi:hypothetical protein